MNTRDEREEVPHECDCSCLMDDDGFLGLGCFVAHVLPIGFCLGVVIDVFDDLVVSLKC